MFYRFTRVPRTYEEGSPFSGWVTTWDGVIIETSQKLGSFLNKPIELLISWADERNIKWSVTERGVP